MRNAIYCVSHKELNSFISNTITQNLETKTDRKLKLVLSSRVTAKNERSVPTGWAEKIYTLSKLFAISVVSTLQRHVIWEWNGNFVGFLGLFSKIAKNFPIKRYSHFSGKWQNQPTRI